MSESERFEKIFGKTIVGLKYGSLGVSNKYEFLLDDGNSLLVSFNDHEGAIYVEKSSVEIVAKKVDVGSELLPC
jgi:hypothetical protein